jgi:hypothetical protein
MSETIFAFAINIKPLMSMLNGGNVKPISN